MILRGVLVFVVGRGFELIVVLVLVVVVVAVFVFVVFVVAGLFLLCWCLFCLLVAWLFC